MIINRNQKSLNIGLKPCIKITAKAGAVLNLRFSGSSAILQTYTLTNDETSHIFTVDISPTGYIITDATNNKDSDVILVDECAIFSTVIVYGTYLYNLGNECSSLTGGWSAYPYRVGGYNNAKTPTLIKNASNMYFEMYDTTGGGSRGVVMPNNQIDLTGYSHLKAHIISSECYMSINNEVGTWFGITNVKSDSYPALTGDPVDLSIASTVVYERDKIIEVPVTSFQGYYYIIFQILAFGAATYYEKTLFDKVWLE